MKKMTAKEIRIYNEEFPPLKKKEYEIFYLNGWKYQSWLSGEFTKERNGKRYNSTEEEFDRNYIKSERQWDLMIKRMEGKKKTYTKKFYLRIWKGEEFHLLTRDNLKLMLLEQEHRRKKRIIDDRNYFNGLPYETDDYDYKILH